MEKRLLAVSFLPLLAVYAGLVLWGNIYLTFALYHGVVCLLVPLIGLGRKGTPVTKALGLSGGAAARAAAAGLVAGLACLVLVWGFFRLFGGALVEGEKIKALLTGWGLGDLRHPAFLVYFTVGNAVIEELFWRGYLYGGFRQSHGAVPSSLLVSFCFIQYHLLTVGLLFTPLTALLFAPLIFAGSLGWCWLRHRYGNIYAVLVSHLLCDLGIIIVYCENV